MKVNNVNLQIVKTDKTDKDKAEEFKRRIVEVYTPMIEIMNEAYNEGFHIQVVCGPTALGFAITNLIVAKHY